MENIKKELGVQSYCFRNYKKNKDVANCVKDIGLERIELCGVHVDFNDQDSFDKVINTYRDAGVDIVSIGVVQLTAEESEIRPYFEFANKAGLKHISVSFQPEGMEEVLELANKMAEEYDVFLGIHNHGGHHWLGNSQMLKAVFSKAGSRIGLCLDTAWALDAGEDPIKMAREFYDRLYCVHFKDFNFDNSGEPEDVIVGTGNLDLKDLIDLLEENDYQGISILEYEGNVDNPVPSLAECVEVMEKEWN